MSYLGSSSAEEVLGVMVSSKLSPGSDEGQQCPGLCQQEQSQQIKESNYSIYSAAVRPHAEHCIQLGALQYRKSTVKLEWVQGRATMVVGARACDLWGQAEGPELAHLERECLWVEHYRSLQYLKRTYQGDGARLFPAICGVWRLRDNGHKVKSPRFRLDRCPHEDK